MALKIEQPEVEELARELAKRTGESVDDAVATAIRERLTKQNLTDEIRASRVNGIIRDLVVEEIVERMRHEPLPDPVAARAAIREIQEYLATLPVLDPRSPDEILGYGEDGLPH